MKCGGCRHCQGKYSPKALEEKKIANHVTYADDDDKGEKGQNANEMKGRPTEREPTPRPTEGAPTPRTTRTTAPENDVSVTLREKPSKVSLAAEQSTMGQNQVILSHRKFTFSRARE